MGGEVVVVSLGDGVGPQIVVLRFAVDGDRRFARMGAVDRNRDALSRQFNILARASATCHFRQRAKV